MPNSKNSAVTSSVMTENSTVEIAGRAYELRALPLQYVVSRELANDRLFYADADENSGLRYACLSDRVSLEAADKWMQRLLRVGGRPMSLRLAAEHGWSAKDLATFLDAVVEVSGLEADGEPGKRESADWGELFSALMFRGTMRKRDILGSSLPFLYAVLQNLPKQTAMALGLPTDESGKPAADTTDMSDEAFYSMVNSAMAGE